MRFAMSGSPLRMSRPEFRTTYLKPGVSGHGPSIFGYYRFSMRGNFPSQQWSNLEQAMDGPKRSGGGSHSIAQMAHDSLMQRVAEKAALRLSNPRNEV